MAGLAPADMRLLIQTTLEDLPKQNFEVGWDHLDYEFCRFYQSERMVVDGGESITRYVMLDPGGNARYRLPFDQDTPTINTTMLKINVPWCRVGTHYSWDITEILQNRGNPHGIIDLVQARRTDELWGLANLIEERGWKTPSTSTSTLHPYGVPYYLNAIDADSTTGGFVGQTIRFQDATTSTTCAGINASTSTKWKNYADIYTDVDNAFLDTLRTAFVKTNFKVPPFVKDPSDKRVAPKRGYADADTIVKMMSLQDARDDNHTPVDLFGKVMVPMKVSDDGVVYVNRIPFIPVTELDGVTDPVTSDAYAPVYVVDFSKFIPVVLRDYWMEESEPMTQASSHTTYTLYLDGAHQNLVTNRRTLGFIIHKAITS